MRASSTVEIDSGPEPIWRLLSTPERYPDYVAATDKVLETSDDIVKVGST
jgi:uncharacterized protein YndB with AHSA1/START domain